MDYYRDTNVGMGLVPHKKICSCVECENEKLRTENKQLREDLKETVRQRDLAFALLGEDFDIEAALTAGKGE